MRETKAEPFTPAERAVMAARAEAAEWRARYEDVARSRQAAGPVLEAAADVCDDYADDEGPQTPAFARLRRAVAALRAADATPAVQERMALEAA